jgi:hypothetical protein
MITQFTNFQGELSIGQITQPDVQARVQWFIDKYEPRFLTSLLGKALADEFTTEYAKSTHDVKWDNLAAKITPMLTSYIYFYYQNDNEVAAMGIGGVVEEGENGSRTTMQYKCVWAWNDMQRQAVDFKDWIDTTVYPNYAGARISEIYCTKNTFGL